MASSFGQAGSTTKLVSLLQGTEYVINTLSDVIDFQKNYQIQYDALKEKAKIDLAATIAKLDSDIAQQSTEYAQHLADKKIELGQELEKLNSELPLLQKKEENFFKNLIQKVRYYFANTRKTYLDQNIVNEAKRIYRSEELTIVDLQKELDDKKTNTETWVEKLTQQYTAQLQWVQKTISTNTQLLHDAQSEELVIEKLSKLPEDYFMINNYSKKFYKPLQNKATNEWVSSSLIDHIVIGPTGLFCIDTKYWDADHMGPSNLAQSAKELIASDFVLSTILNQSAYQGDLPPFRINGVPVPITPKNIILLMNTSTVEPIEKVSVQTIDTIHNTIVNSDKIFAPDAIECLKNFLLNKDNTTGYQSI
jgi:hypothetical protein